MAKRELIIEMLNTFMGIWDRREISEQTKSAYVNALKHYSDDEIRTAGYKAIDELQYFPKPSEILKLLKKSKHDKEEKEHWTCPMCHSQVVCIIDGKCKYCNARMPLNIPRPKYKTEKYKDDTAFDIGYGVRCDKCGKITTCIYEPPEIIWQCRECYSGISNDEYKRRMEKIIEIIDEKGTANEYLEYPEVNLLNE